MEAEGVGAAIDAVLARPKTSDLVAAYFRAELGFAGSTFDDFGENPPDRLTPDDLVAVSLLDVSFSPAAVRAWFPVSGDSEVNRRLASPALPSDVDLWDPDAPLVEAANTWTLLTTFPGVGPVKAGKLLARKRPRLVPVVDSVILRLLGRPDEVWDSLAMSMSSAERRSRVAQLRPEGLGESTSVLRVLDVALWMWGSRSRRARAVRLGLGATEEGR